MYTKKDKNSDRFLWSEMKKGNKKAFETIYAKYAESMFQFGFEISSDVEVIKEAVQELFLEYWSRRKKLSEVEHLKTYLLKSTRYKILNKIKQEKRYQSFMIGQNDIVDPVESKIIEQEILAQKTFILRKQIANLPKRQAEIIHLKYYQRLNNNQISDILNISQQSVANLLQRALSSLKTTIFKKNVI
jgi:RNA polymerase sigma factor (sigma-70 family)